MVKLTKDLKADEFYEYYFLKEELKDFCRKEGLKISGTKNQLEKRIFYYLDTEKSLDDEKINVNTNNSSNTSNINNTNNNSSKPIDENKNKGKTDLNHSEITLDSILGENFKCSEDKREFFKKEVGKGFKFKVKFQKWLKSNPNKRYKDAINAYHEIQNSKEKNKIDKQFQYNQYIRDFFKNNSDKRLEDAIKCWNYKKSLKGHNKYEKSDLNVLNSP